MTKDLYQVVDDLFSRLPLYAVDYTRVVEIDEVTIKGVIEDRVVVEGNWYFKIDDLKATRVEAEREAEANINKAREERVKQVKVKINELLEEVKELMK